MTYTQINRRIAISTPLGDDVLLLKGFTGLESISQIFEFHLHLLSENESLSFQDIVGKEVTLSVQSTDGDDRYWHGLVSHFSQGEKLGDLTSYQATMVPWLWFLNRTSDCRIFQNQKVPDIIQKVFKDLNFSDFELRLHGDFAVRDYCVQYRETDFNFVSRLMEEEGIYYFFKQSKEKHVLILANDPAAHEAVPYQATARLAPLNARSYEDVITSWDLHEEFRTGTWTQTDYNFETPSTDLRVAVNGKNPYEIYEFPGEYGVRGEGNRLAKIRLQEQSAPLAVTTGRSTCRHFGSGLKFTLQNHYRKDQNQQYLLVGVKHTASQPNYDVGSGTDEESSYTNDFTCIPFSTPYRPQRATPASIVQGCQTAVVVGPAGEEIYTDNHGRVKVQFHWDREGKKNENSSCWIRVSHPWAGKGWGSLSIPRIGQEVIVDFLEGNPDQPIIVGRVYNAEQTPPFGMPGGAMISGVISNSTKGGGGNNEISLNDTKGNELINIHAQYDQQKKIEHDERVNVGHDRTESVGHDEKITIGHNRTEMVQANEIATIALMRTHNVGINDMLNVGAANEVTVGGLQAITVGLGRALTVGLNQQTTIGHNKNTKVGKAYVLDAGDSIVIKTGASSITMKSDGTISIDGKHIFVNGSQVIAATAKSIDLN
jgi:type VI secretion system secreted protein VgrG